MTSKQVTSPPWNSRRLQQRNGWGIALVGPCSHSIGKFFLCYTVFFPFWNFRPRLARELHVCLVYIALNSKNLSKLYDLYDRAACIYPAGNFSSAIAHGAAFRHLVLSPTKGTSALSPLGPKSEGRAGHAGKGTCALSSTCAFESERCAGCVLFVVSVTGNLSCFARNGKVQVSNRSMRAWFNTTAGDGCDQLGTFSSKYEKRAEVCGVQSVWREYMLFHNSCRFRTDCAVLRWQCADEDFCGGIADQQRGLVSALLIAIITKRMLLVHWQRFGVNIQSTVFAPGMIDTRASPLYADRCKTLQHEAPLQSIDPRTTREADRIVKTVKESKKLCLGLQTNLKPELLLASSAAKGFEGFKGFYDLPLRGCAHRFMFKPGNSVWL